MTTGAIRRLLTRALIILAVAIFVPAGGIAQSLPAPGSDAAPGQAPKTQAAPSGVRKADEDALCPKDYPPETPSAAGTPHGTLTIRPNTRWQPVGGEVQFALTGMERPPENISVYFAWQTARETDKSYCHRSPRVRLLPRTTASDDTTYLYAARVPSFETNPPWLEGSGHRQPTSTVPVADMYVHGIIPVDNDKPVAFVLTDSLGIATPWIASVVAFAGLLLAGGVLTWWAKKRGLPGGWLLRIIASPSGVASLSQFQIFLWTAVIGTGVVYVMMLSGNLIDIPVATLGLLGISGFALVGSKLQAGPDSSPQRVSPPGGVTGLTVAGTPTSPSALVAATTPARTPRWSDLVMSGDTDTQVDLARLQMLVFTSIAALFTGLTLFNTGAIPDIPVGELALVGVSNGVYLASKVADR
jgi:hypothetical protein